MSDRHNDCNAKPTLWSIAMRIVMVLAGALILIVLGVDPIDPSWLNMVAIVSWGVLITLELRDLSIAIRKRYGTLDDIAETGVWMAGDGTRFLTVTWHCRTDEYRVSGWIEQERAANNELWADHNTLALMIERAEERGMVPFDDADTRAMREYLGIVS